MMQFDKIVSFLVNLETHLSKHVQTCPKLQYDKILLNLSKHLRCNLTQSYHFLSILKLTCLDLSETVKMTKYTKIEQMVQRSALKKSYSLDRFDE